MNQNIQYQFVDAISVIELTGVVERARCRILEDGMVMEGVQYVAPTYDPKAESLIYSAMISFRPRHSLGE